jgi:hypothetical protein
MEAKRNEEASARSEGLCWGRTSLLFEGAGYRRIRLETGLLRDRHGNRD